MRFIFKIVGWLSNLFHRRSRKYAVEFISDNPETALPDVLYIVGEHGCNWVAVMLCPCGCGEMHEMNLLPDAKPCWSLSIKKSVPTLNPSVWLKTCCHSHFVLTDGKIKWVNQPEQSLYSG